MTDCRVVCHDCVTDKGPRRWRWLCVTCAEECQEQHRKETGHNPELTVVPEDAEDLRNFVSTAALYARRGW